MEAVDIEQDLAGLDRVLLRLATTEDDRLEKVRQTMGARGLFIECVICSDKSYIMQSWRRISLYFCGLLARFLSSALRKGALVGPMVHSANSAQSSSLARS